MKIRETIAQQKLLSANYCTKVIEMGLLILLLTDFNSIRCILNYRDELRENVDVCFMQKLPSMFFEPIRSWRKQGDNTVFNPSSYELPINIIFMKSFLDLAL